MEEKYKKFKEYDWVESKEWQSYYTNIFPTPPPSKILRYKKKFYRNKIDPDFDIDYKPPNEEEQNSYSSANTSSSYYNANANNNTNASQDNFSTEQTFETYRAAQTLANPIDSPPLKLLENILLLLFLFSLPFRYKTVLLALLAFLVRTIRIVGIPKFDLTYLQAFIMNDSCHTLLFALQSLSDRLNYYMMLPVVVSTIIALCDNIRYMDIGGVKQYIDLVNNKREELIQSKSHIEVAIGFVSIAGIFLKINSILTPIIYWQLMRVRYTLNPYIKKSFTDLNNLANQIKLNEKTPGAIKFIIDKVQLAFSYMGKINNPQPGQQGAGRGMGSMCNVF